MSITYLVKDSNSLLSHCYCDTARIASPGQLSCPWCGCGWLFSCIRCRKSFTFARAEEIDATWEEMARLDILCYSKREPKQSDIELNTRLLREIHEGVEVGKRYVFFDGMIIDVEAGGIRGDGQHAFHDLDYVPQVAALKDRSRLNWILQNVQYWEENAHPRRELRRPW